ncbi:MAG: sugar phosphate nucleotidyltransferase [bacterium]
MSNRTSSNHEPVRRAMILAAGYGTRLRPITEELAKPLLPVVNRPLLIIVADTLRAIGVTEIAVNTHHLADQVEDAVVALAEDPTPTDLPVCKYTIFHEPEILGTGGALWNARGFLERDDEFLLYNGDVLCNLDLGELIYTHRRGGGLVTLVLTDWPEVNSVLLASNGAVRDIGDHLTSHDYIGDRRLTYTGIAMLSSSLLKLLPTGPSSLVDTLLRILVEQPGSVRGHVLAGQYWSDLGTVERYLAAHADLLVGRAGAPGSLPLPPDSFQLDATAQVAGDVELAGFVCVGPGASIGSGASLRDCVVLSGAVVDSRTSYREAVIGDGWVVEADGGEALTTVRDLTIIRQTGWGDGLRVATLTGHGSDRSFYRLVEGDRSELLMRSTKDDPEFERFIAIGTFLHEQKLGGPALLSRDPRGRTVIMEDLGGQSLHRMATVDVEDADLHAPLYWPVLDLLVKLQTVPTDVLKSCPEACDRRLDYDTLRWETDYFRQRFLGELVGIAPGQLVTLDDEFHRLATTALEQPIVPMHRDFQSQNIFFKDGLVRMVDFQGLRVGPLTYDVMSLLRDSYVDLGSELREELLEYYRGQLAEQGGPALERDELLEMAVVAGLQRNMQALGAFAFLSKVKGKAHFRRYIPLGLRHLREGLAVVREGGCAPGSLERLERVVGEVVERLG